MIPVRRVSHWGPGVHPGLARGTWRLALPFRYLSPPRVIPTVMFVKDSVYLLERSLPGRRNCLEWRNGSGACLC